MSSAYKTMSHIKRVLELCAEYSLSYAEGNAIETLLANQESDSISRITKSIWFLQQYLEQLAVAEAEKASNEFMKEDEELWQNDQQAAEETFFNWIQPEDSLPKQNTRCTYVLKNNNAHTGFFMITSAGKKVFTDGNRMSDVSTVAAWTKANG